MKYTHTALVTRAAGCTHTRQAWFRRRVSDRLRSVHFIRTVVAMLQRRNHRSHMCKGSGTEKGRYLVGATAEDNVQVQTRPTTLITPPAYLFWPTLGPSRLRLRARPKTKRRDCPPRRTKYRYGFTWALCFSYVYTYRLTLLVVPVLWVGLSGGGFTHILIHTRTHARATLVFTLAVNSVGRGRESLLYTG